MSFLTVEDYNTANISLNNSFYELNTANIGTDEFDSVLYDFCVVSHEKWGNQHKFTIEIHNDLWCGGVYWFIAGTASFDSSTNTITIYNAFSTVRLFLVMCNYLEFSYKTIAMTPTDNYLSLALNELGEDYTFNMNMYNLQTGKMEPSEVTATLDEGVNEITIDGDKGYVYVIVKKTDLLYDLSTENVTTGTVNHVRLHVNSHYLPLGDLVDGEELDILVKYNDLEIPVEYDDTIGDYCFDLDLTGKLDDSNVHLTVHVFETANVNSGIANIIVDCNYPTASTFTELKSQITSGARVIELTDSIVSDSNLVLTNPLSLIGDNHSWNLGDNSIILVANVNYTFKGIDFYNGAPVFQQNGNSSLVLDGCSFTNARITDTCKGSVLSTLNGDNITTEFNNCLKLNCYHSIWHNGALNIHDTRALFNNYNDSVDTDYSVLLTQYDGEVNITQSTFDLNIDDTVLCDDTIDIKFAESMFGFGENTIINGTLASKLQGDNSLNNLFESPSNNRAHTYVEYYYPAITACVITSPVTGMEDKNICHILLGNDWIYKNNTQVTKKSANTENTTRTITWEED